MDDLEATDRIAAVEAERDRAYRGRAEVIAVLSAILEGRFANGTQLEDWPVLILDTPAGQVSWHINPADLDLFQAEILLATEPGPIWDGHDDIVKSARLARTAEFANTVRGLR